MYSSVGSILCKEVECVPNKLEQQEHFDAHERYYQTFGPSWTTHKVYACQICIHDCLDFLQTWILSDEEQKQPCTQQEDNGECDSLYNVHIYVLFGRYCDDHSFQYTLA